VRAGANPAVAFDIESALVDLHERLNVEERPTFVDAVSGTETP
jgi:hypothetical protein